MSSAPSPAHSTSCTAWELREQRPSPGSSGMGVGLERRCWWGKVQTSPGSPGGSAWDEGAVWGGVPETWLQAPGRHHGFIQVVEARWPSKGGDTWSSPWMPSSGCQVLEPSLRLQEREPRTPTLWMAVTLSQGPWRLSSRHLVTNYGPLGQGPAALPRALT